MAVDLALVFPRFSYPSGDPPIGLASIAAAVRQAGYKVAIVDATFHPSVDWVVGEIERLDPEWVGMHVSTLMLPDASRILGRLRLLSDLGKTRRRKVIVGGPHITVRPEDAQFLYDPDEVVRGEGEVAAVHILSGAEVVAPSRLPHPALDLLAMPRYARAWHYMQGVLPGEPGTNLMASRGCPYHCTYCQPTLENLFGKGVRYRDPDDVIEEMEELHDRYGLRAFFFQDDTLTVNRRWLREFMRGLEKMRWSPLLGSNARVDTVDDRLLEEMAVHGWRSLHFGAESGSQRVLDEVYRKGITVEQVREAVHLAQKWRISVGAFYILGAPGETREEVEMTVKEAVSLPVDEVSFSLFVPLPGTAIYDALEAQGVRLSHDFKDFDYYARQPFQGEIPLPELKRIQREALVRFYWQRKGYIARHLTSLSGMRRLAQKVRRFA